MAAAVVGAFTLVGLAGSYTRMLLKTESFNQMRQERETLRQNYRQMAQIAHDRDVQVSSLGALASEVTTLYGLKQSRLSTTTRPAAPSRTESPVADASPQSLAFTDDQTLKQSVDEFYSLRTMAMSGRVSRVLQGGLLRVGYEGGWSQLADAPSIWPLEGRVTSGFGERQDPFNGEGGEFHPGLDIGAILGTPVRVTADGDVVEADMGMGGYGHHVMVNHGHDLITLYGHLSALAVLPGQHVTRGQVIGFVGQTGRATGPHLHYEVRVHNVPVNPHKYLRTTYEQLGLDDGPGLVAGK